VEAERDRLATACAEHETSVSALSMQLLAVRAAAVEAERETHLERDAAAATAAVNRGGAENALLARLAAAVAAAAEAEATGAVAGITAAAAEAAARDANERLAVVTRERDLARSEAGATAATLVAVSAEASAAAGECARLTEASRVVAREQVEAQFTDRLAVREAEGTIRGLQKDVDRAESMAASAVKARDAADGKLANTERELGAARVALLDMRESITSVRAEASAAMSERESVCFTAASSVEEVRRAAGDAAAATEARFAALLEDLHDASVEVAAANTANVALANELTALKKSGGAEVADHEVAHAASAAALAALETQAIELTRRLVVAETDAKSAAAASSSAAAAALDITAGKRKP